MSEVLDFSALCFGEASVGVSLVTEGSLLPSGVAPRIPLPRFGSVYTQDAPAELLKRCCAASPLINTARDSQKVNDFSTWSYSSGKAGLYVYHPPSEQHSTTIKAGRWALHLGYSHRGSVGSPVLLQLGALKA